MAHAVATVGGHAADDHHYTSTGLDHRKILGNLEGSVWKQPSCAFANCACSAITSVIICRSSVFGSCSMAQPLSRNRGSIAENNAAAKIDRPPKHQGVKKENGPAKSGPITSSCR